MVELRYRPGFPEESHRALVMGQPVEVGTIGADKGLETFQDAMPLEKANQKAKADRHCVTPRATERRLFVLARVGSAVTPKEELRASRKGGIDQLLTVFGPLQKGFAEQMGIEFSADQVVERIQKMVNRERPCRQGAAIPNGIKSRRRRHMFQNHSQPRKALTQFGQLPYKNGFSIQTEGLGVFAVNTENDVEFFHSSEHLVGVGKIPNSVFAVRRDTLGIQLSRYGADGFELCQVFKGHSWLDFERHERLKAGGGDLDLAAVRGQTFGRRNRGQSIGHDQDSGKSRPPRVPCEIPTVRALAKMDVKIVGFDDGQAVNTH